MNKTKKGLLTASSIITIIISCFAILLAVIMFFVVGEFDEKAIKKEFLQDKTLTYYEEVDGQYYFQGITDDGEEITIYEKDIETIAKFMKIVIISTGITFLVTLKVPTKFISVTLT